MKTSLKIVAPLILLIFMTGCTPKKDITAKDILGNPDYLAMSFGGYKHKTRDSVPSVDEIKDDLKISAVLGIKLIRTYNTQHYDQAANLLKAIRQLKEEDSNFEMYVMLGAWIECKDAWKASKDHTSGNVENNIAEIEMAVAMANEYPDIVKMIAVGNESMIQWATGYFVYPNIILKWVNHLQDLKKSGGLPKDVWITSSDNYEAWGGGSEIYQTEDLTALLKAVDFVSLHTYPFHSTFYDITFWGTPSEEENLSDKEKIGAAMVRAKNYAIAQYQSTADYITSLGIKKPIHIGETGWATNASRLYGATGSHAADEYKEKVFYQDMRKWTNNAGISCFYFKVFDENWKDDRDELGSENHFGFIKLNGQAKYVLWNLVDKGVFDGLTRDGVKITKTYNGDEALLMKDVLTPPTLKEIGILETSTVNDTRKVGETVTEGTYVIINESLVPNTTNNMTYPSAKLKLNAIDGTCNMKMIENSIIEIRTGTGDWWVCNLQLETGEDLSKFEKGQLHFEIKGNTNSSFKVGFQTGYYTQGTQVDNYVTFGPKETYSITEKWTKHTISMAELNKNADLTAVTGIIYCKGVSNFDGKNLSIKNMYYTQE